MQVAMSAECEVKLIKIIWNVHRGIVIIEMFRSWLKTMYNCLQMKLCSSNSNE